MYEVCSFYIVPPPNGMHKFVRMQLQGNTVITHVTMRLAHWSTYVNTINQIQTLSQLEESMW